MTSSVNNYTIAKGVVSFKPTGGVYRDLGNASLVEFTPNIEKLEHYSSRTGVKTKDRTVILQKSGTIRIVLDEWMDENIALALLGSIDSSGNISIFTESSVSGMLKIVQSNDVGPKKIYEFASVDIIPSGAIGFISEEWATLELEAECAAVAGSFGTVTDVA